MKTRPGACPTLPPAAAFLLASIVSCGSYARPCDGAPNQWCSDSVIWRGGCGGDVIVGACAKGCITDETGAGAYSSVCPLTLCRENEPKTGGESCEVATDCQPTVAAVSTTAVENIHLTCDTGSKTCVTTDGPVVADWLKPCNATLIAELVFENGQAHDYDGVLADSGCAEGWCAFHHVAGASCAAHGCTRRCTADHECPRGSTCADAAPAGCRFSTPVGHCRPGGPASIGFTCNLASG